MIATFVFICLAVASFVQCTDTIAKYASSVPAANAVTKISSQYYTLVDKAFNSEHFKPAALLGKDALDTTSYSVTGFTTMTFYEGTTRAPDSTCHSPTFVHAEPVNYCVITPTYAYKVQITGDSCTGGVIQYFADAGCTQFVGVSALQPYANVCAVSAAPSLVGMNHAVFMLVECTNSAQPMIPAEAVTVETFDSDTCSGTISQYMSYTSNACVYSGGSTLQYSCANGVPMVNVYGGAPHDCSGTPAYSGPVSNGCGSDDEHSSGDDYVPFVNPPPTTSTTSMPTPLPSTTSSITYCPNTAPTVKPAFSPTMFPTSASSLAVSFSATQIITGITADAFDAVPANAIALSQTIASTMTDVIALDIDNLVVSDVAASRRRLSSMTTQSASSISASYTVAVSTALSPSQLYFELSTAVESGAFNTALNAYALTANATALKGCTSYTITEGRGGAGGGDTSGLSQAALICIIVGAVGAFCILIGLCVAVFVYSKRSEPMASQQASTGVANQA